MINMDRMLKWAQKGSLLFAGTVLFLVVTTAVARAADPTGAICSVLNMCHCTSA